MKSYLITDPEYYSNDLKTFETKLNQKIKLHTPNMVCFRDKNSKNIDSLAEVFVRICKKHLIEDIYINTHIELAKKYNAKGVHLNSTQFDKINFAKNLNLKVIISCHNHEDIKNAIDKRADFVTYSPIFNTPNKNKPKGLEDLKKVVEDFNIGIIALGGIISKSQIKLINKTGSYGFGSIRYFI